jgi:hypothetical protein
MALPSLPPVRSRLRAAAVASILASALLVPGAALASGFAPDGADFTGGYGDNVAIYGIGVHWDSICSCQGLKRAGFDVKLAAQLAYWQGKERPASNTSLWDVALTPVFRWSAPEGPAARLFLEAGIGAHLLSDTRINTERVFSTAFQFGEIGVIGLAFGERYRYEIGALVQHVSNGAIKEPNNGLTYFGAVFRARLP